MDRYDLYEIVENKIHEIFLEYQKSENIKSCDITLDESLVLDEMKDKLTDFVIDSMKDNERGMSCAQFLQDYDVKLHQIYYMMQAYWYDTKDPKMAEITKTAYCVWADDWFFDILEGNPGATKEVFEKEINDVLKEYQNRLSTVKTNKVKPFDAGELCDIYNGSDIEALDYMHEYLDGELKELCERLIDLNNNTLIGWGKEPVSMRESEEYYEGKWKLLNHFGIENSNGDAVLPAPHLEEKTDKLSGSEFICSLPQDWQQRIKDAIISTLTEFYDTTDLDKAVVGHRSIRALAEEVMNGRLTDLEDAFDWRDVLNGGDGHYEARDEEEREI